MCKPTQKNDLSPQVKKLISSATFFSMPKPIGPVNEHSCSSKAQILGLIVGRTDNQDVKKVCIRICEDCCSAIDEHGNASASADPNVLGQQFLKQGIEEVEFIPANIDPDRGIRSTRVCLHDLILQSEAVEA